MTCLVHGTEGSFHSWQSNPLLNADGPESALLPIAHPGFFVLITLEVALVGDVIVQDTSRECVIQQRQIPNWCSLTRRHK